MLIPRFSLKVLFLWVGASSLVSVVFGLALRGYDWAIGVSLALLMAGLTFLVQAATFGLALVMARLWDRVFTPRQVMSPFVEDRPIPGSEP